jgi:hypothetical protein
MQIATSGQSRQSFVFCSSGQQGMSAGIDDMPAISAATDAFATAGVASGARTSPAMIDIASNRAESRHNTIPYLGTAGPRVEEASLSHMRKATTKNHAGVWKIARWRVRCWRISCDEPAICF